MRHASTTACPAVRRVAPIRLLGRTSSVFRELFATLQSVLLPLSLILFATAAIASDLVLALAATLLLFVSNVVYGCMRLRERILFIFLHAGIALFLLTRPLVATFDSERTWFLSSLETTWFAISSIFVSMVFLYLGAALYTAACSFNDRRRNDRDKLRSGISVLRLSAKDSECQKRKSSSFYAAGHTVGNLVSGFGRSERIKYIRMASLLLFIVCFFAALYEGAVKLSYMSGLSYEDYYLIESSDHVPWIIGVLKPMMLYALCSYLACMPRRRPTVICLTLYTITTLPMLIIGSRSDFVIAFLFAALYFILRAVTDTEERWITKRLIAAACLVAPVGIFAMGMMNYTRAGDTVNGMGFVSLVFDALYKQGVSFTVLGHGYDVNPQVQELGFRFFTIGSVISTVTQGFIGQTFLGCPDLGSTNSALLALNGNSYAHAMSFFAHPNYLGGEGYGSSYILELYADFGFAGIIVGSLILGVAFSFMSTLIARRWFGGMVALTAATAVFHMPRGYFIEWIEFVITTRFLLAVVLIAALSAVLFYAAHAEALPVQLRLRHVATADWGGVCTVMEDEVETVVRPCLRAGEYGTFANRHGVPVSGVSVLNRIQSD